MTFQYIDTETAQWAKCYLNISTPHTPRIIQKHTQSKNVWTSQSFLTQTFVASLDFFPFHKNISLNQFIQPTAQKFQTNFNKLLVENDCSTLIIRGSPDAHPREFETSLFFSANETNMLTNRLQLEHSRPLRPEKKMGTFKAAPAFILITLCVFEN